jgi:Gpi18-like mannosyltransferase
MVVALVTDNALLICHRIILIFMSFRNLIFDHKLAGILLLGIIVRIVLIPISAHPFDIYYWYLMSNNILQNGLLSVHFFPPLWVHYTMIPVAFAYDWLAHMFNVSAIPMASLPSAFNFYPSSNLQYVPGLLFNTVVKFPLLISDVLVTFLIYKIAYNLTENKRLAEKAALLWFLNPFLIWISASWGMWDTLAVLFSLLSFYLVLRKRIALSAVFLSLAVATKLYPVLFLLPFVLYLLKIRPGGGEKRNVIKFLSVFSVISVIIFLPDIAAVTEFISVFLVPNNLFANLTVANPIVYPIGYGLTYWSIYLPIQRFGMSITSSAVYFLPIMNLVVVIVSLALANLVILRFSFKKPSLDLVLAMLLSIFAFFLSYRIICEQWLVWALPFMIILIIAKRMKLAYYWGVSIIALIYSVLNCPLPFFFLPLEPWLKSDLLSMIYAIWAVESYRILLLAVIGCLFSLLVLLILNNLRKSKSSGALENY